MEAATTSGTTAHAPFPHNPNDPQAEPAAWLKAFEHLGGGYAVGEHYLRLCILLGDQTDAELSLARVMIKGLTLEDRAAIYDHLRGGGAPIGES